MKKIALAISTEAPAIPPKTQNTRDQRDDQKRNDPAQHKTPPRLAVALAMAATAASRIACRINPGRE